ncbi:MAG TPA: hypothetical protein VII36_02810 [Usitatibacter sp.]
MHDHAPWHAEGLRWIGSLLQAAADRIERASIAAAPCEPAPADRRRDDDLVDEVRLRIQSRYY